MRLCATVAAILLAAPVAGDDTFFDEQVAPILKRHCVRCHKGSEPGGGLNLTAAASFRSGGDSGEAFVPGKPGDSLLIDMVSGPEPEMPKNADPLAVRELDVLRQWIDDGAVWPNGVVVAEAANDWWSLQPLQRQALPPTAGGTDPIDTFVRARLQEQGFEPSAEADRRSLIRRLSFDLTGLPPRPAAIREFVADPRPDAWPRLIDKLLASPHYGERWARHWLDVVHYGDTHGYDKDKLRAHAWPYRDYVVRSWNQDKPYARFVQEQLAGDVLWPESPDGIEATGFIAAGPWDFIGHAEVPESKIDGQVARHMDRDDMVRTTMETFNSLTVGFAQCHDHKFDPVTMQDYYSLQAVFAALDRAERPYDADPRVALKRRELTARRNQLETRTADYRRRLEQAVGPDLKQLERDISQLRTRDGEQPRPEFGYHSRIAARNDVVKWVQVDLGRSTELAQVVIVGCHDTFADIGAGFGFPVRFRIETSDDADFRTGVRLIVDRTQADVANPGVTPLAFPVAAPTGRYVRVTATRLASRRPTDFIFALAELMALRADGTNVARGNPVTALDSIEAPVRWRRTNLVDGYFYGTSADADAARLAQLQARRARLLDQAQTAAMRHEGRALDAERNAIGTAFDALPPQQRVYCGCVHNGTGNFRGRAGLGPREIHVLNRGQVTQPGQLVAPATVASVIGGGDLDLPAEHGEGERRVGLARWLTRRDHPLTWRSIANRVWLYHFGRGLVDSPNDFGRMGQSPTHPQLLDWLATELRDGDGSLKQLHRRILSSATWRQSSRMDTTTEAHRVALRTDADNRFLWRQNRRRLDAEAIRDSVLWVAGRLNTSMGGPGFRDFVLRAPEHSPHYEYHKHDPSDSLSHRRSVYRFLVRSQPQPFMDTLNCADPSQLVAKRNDTLSVLQALSLLNNRFVLHMSEQFAAELQREHPTSPATRIRNGFRQLTGRAPAAELQALVDYAEQFGLPNACRLLLNLNEFVFVD